MADLQSLIANLGFLIANFLYLLVRIEGKLQVLTDSISDLSHNITNMTNK
ncbi:YvrJ family protein [Terrisporobacter glycolicus]|nr:YvrJ family protein [Terrisporobacter glycolicus]